MIRIRNVLARLWNVFRRRRLEQDLNSELQSHLDLLIEENIQRGMDPKEAAHAARREFGGLEQTKEEYREQRSLPFLETLLQDVRYGLRMLASAWRSVRKRATSSAWFSPMGQPSRWQAGASDWLPPWLLRG